MHAYKVCVTGARSRINNRPWSCTIAAALAPAFLTLPRPPKTAMCSCEVCDTRAGIWTDKPQTIQAKVAHLPFSQGLLVPWQGGCDSHSMLCGVWRFSRMSRMHDSFSGRLLYGPGIRTIVSSTTSRECQRPLCCRSGRWTAGAKWVAFDPLLASCTGEA